MLENQLYAYKGTEPYIFISYAHADTERVYPLLEALQQSGYRVWFDCGIEAGTEWSNNIAEHLSNCETFLFFASNKSVKSENCLDEVAYAKSHNKPALLAYLEEDVVLPAGTEMQTARFQRMYINRQSSMAAFVENLSASSIFDNCREGGAQTVVKEVATPSAPANTKKPLNKKKFIVAGIAVLAAIAVILSATFIFGGKKGKGSTDKGGVIADSDFEYVAPTELSASISDHTFRLDGKLYRLPLSYTTLTADGWTLGTGATPDLLVGGHLGGNVAMVKNGKTIYVDIYNDIENAKPVKDCLIGGVSVEVSENLDFAVAGGIIPSDTADKMSDVFGTPSDRYEGSDYVKLTWSIGENAGVMACVYEGEDSGDSYIKITNIVFSSVVTPINKTAPSYLGAYIAPTALGTDIFASIVSVEDALYEIPAPVSEFIKNGWKITSGVDAVASGGTAAITLKKGDAQIDLTIVNCATYKTTAENCLATKIVVDNSNTKCTLPGGISIGMGHSTLKSLIPSEMDSYEGSYTASYTYSEYKERDFDIRLSVDVEKQILTSITIINDVSGIIEE